MHYILLDESGDLGFKLGSGSSKYFIVTIIFARSKRPLEKIAKTVHSSLSKKHKKVGALHAYKEAPQTRARILRKLNSADCSILAVILNKEKVHTRLRDEKAVLYNYVANILLDRLMKLKPISPDAPITLLASQRETDKFLNQNFSDYLERQISDNHALRLTIEIASPHKEKSLQIVDFGSWALYRKYEIGDDTYYNLINKEKILGESPLFP